MPICRTAQSRHGEIGLIVIIPTTLTPWPADNSRLDATAERRDGNQCEALSLVYLSSQAPPEFAKSHAASPGRPGAGFLRLPYAIAINPTSKHRS
jgi:hypothetical protein